MFTKIRTILCDFAWCKQLFCPAKISLCIFAAMKYYQSILESLFYYFKKSPQRCEQVAAVQALLDEPSLKYREVHQIRWLSFYQALDAVYRTLDSLLTYFSSRKNDPKAEGLKKKLSQDFFLYMTYALMDILQPVMKLNLFFQAKDVDISLVKVTTLCQIYILINNSEVVYIILEVQILLN